MQYNVTVDTGAVASAAGLDPSAVDTWLSGNTGTVHEVIQAAMVDEVKAVTPPLAAAAPPAGADSTAGAGNTNPDANAAAAAELAALQDALDNLPPAVRAKVHDHLDAAGVTPSAPGVGV